MGGEEQGARKFSTARELLLLAGDAEALRLAAERALDVADPGGNGFAHAMAGGLLLLRDRLHVIERVLMGRINPAAVLSTANQADPSEEGPGILREWYAEEIVQRLEAEWRGARYRMEWEDRERKPNAVAPPNGAADRRKPNGKG